MKTYLLIFALLLSGCSAFEQKIGTYKHNQLCCKPDTAFPHSCDGWIVCDNPIMIEE